MYNLLAIDLMQFSYAKGRVSHSLSLEKRGKNTGSCFHVDFWSCESLLKILAPMTKNLIALQAVPEMGHSIVFLF